ncbi:MAG: glutamine--tRNA ligase/YqeY domain fusion protein [Myxococcales bacterium]|nr:glutamine--tRNA ligase/YqeY domain fusion protein [Myxococcales bacterium]
MTASDSTPPADFIRDAIASDLESGRFTAPIVTRLPPEPSGYVHLGNAYAFAISARMAAAFGGQLHLRFDDTNPVKEEQEFVDSIQADIRWLGIDWGEHLYYASDYFEQLYDWAVVLIKREKAFVCDLSADELRGHFGTLTEPGRNSPHRDRSVSENLDLFARMRAGEFDDGSRTLRAKIDMSSGNLNLRDPVMYRILRAQHQRTGDAWCIYPSYDWAHGQSDSIEGITHSLCSLEFEDHRPLYDWFLDELGVFHPRQIEFGRVSVTHVPLGKRKLRVLVEEGHVGGWDDPRMPTLAGLRRRGFTPESLRNFLERVGVNKRQGIIEMAFLEHCLREDLNRRAPRAMAVMRPLRLVIENYPEDQAEELDAINNPEDASAGTRKVPFSRELWVERDDFMEDPPRKFFRLSPGREVRLRYAYFVTCTGVIKDAEGKVVELRCSYDPETRGGDAPDGRRPKATLHWVSARHALSAELRIYEHLFTTDDPDGGGDFIGNLNPGSLELLGDCKLEPSLSGASAGDHFQFERLGYFCVDPDSSPEKRVLNRTVSLRDTWARIQKRRV